MSKSRLATVLLVVFCLLLIAPGCKKPQPEVVPTPPAPAPTPAPVEPPPVEVKSEDIEPYEEPPVEKAPLTVQQLQAQLQTVYFDFDKFDLSESSRSTLRGNAQVLKDNSAFNVVVEGHCDERGSIEYNLALGERRANTTRDYLVTLGVSAGRIRIVSYGEEKPADRGHGESSWAQNRRAEFTVER
jgi:peptidoglycan-associated lipoprotein